MMVSRRTFGARDPGSVHDGTLLEDPLDFDYDVIPYSPTENSRTIQLRNLSQVLDLLSASADIDKRRLVGTVIDLLNLDPDLMISEEEKAMEQQAMMAQMGMEGGGEPQKQLPQVNQRDIRDTSTPGGPIASTGPRVVLPTGAAGGPGDPAPKRK